jgi:hypothetical protein
MTQTVGKVLLVGGIVLLIASLTADMIGVGADPTFGLWQISGSVGGAIAAVVGFVLSRRK